MSRCRFGFFRGRSQCRETISPPRLFARGLRMQGGTMSYSPGDKSSVSQPQSSEATPGWLARSLFWAALVIGALPSLVLAPMPPLWDSNADIIFFIVGSILCTCLRLILGAVAILLVKNTNWAHRLLGAGIYLLGCTALMTTPLTWIFLASLGTEGNGALPAMTTIQGALSSIFLVGVFCGWNIARNRRWWLLAIAVVLGATIALFDMFVARPLAESVTTDVMAAVLVQMVWLVLTFACLGVFHLLGRVNGATAPKPTQPAC